LQSGLTVPLAIPQDYIYPRFVTLVREWQRLYGGKRYFATLGYRRFFCVSKKAILQNPSAFFKLSVNI
jgi:hypothetical protein